MNYTKIKTAIGPLETGANYRAYLLIPQPKVVVELQIIGNEIAINHEKEQYAFSIYDKGKVVVLGAKDGEPQVGVVEVSLYKDRDYDLTLKKVSDEEFKSQLNSLMDN
jgi:hypothetical protein